MTKIRGFFILALALTVLAGTLPAQAPIGKIVGRVLDDQGAALPGVAVTAASSHLVGKATAITDETGSYRLLALPPGTYTIVYILSGFARVTRTDIILPLNQTITVDVALKPATIEEQITVVGQSPLIDVKSTTRGATFNRQMFTSLPKGRNFDTLIAAIPGVVQEDTLLGGTSVDGASGDENMYYIDGVNTNNLVNGTSGQNVNLDFVDEVQVNASGYQAEYGGSMGGVVNVLARRGGNAFHGDLIGYWTGMGLQSKYRDILDVNQIDTTGPNAILFYPYEKYVGTDKWNRFEGGFDLGGFIIKDRLWFFGSFMPQYYKRDRSVDYAIQGSSLVRAFKRTENYWNGLFKLTTQIANNLRLTAGFINNSYRYVGDNQEANSASSTALYNQGWTYPNSNVNGTIDWSLGNNFMVNMRGGWFRTDQINNEVPQGNNTPRYRFMVDQPYGYIASNNRMFPEIPANLQHGGNWSSKSAADHTVITKEVRERINANVDASYFAHLGGEHSFKAGFQFVRNGQNVVDTTSFGPTVMFGWNMELRQSGINYGRGKYGWYSVRNNDKTGPYGNNYNVYANTYALYLQDSWTIANRLTINLGLRAENEYLPNYGRSAEFPSIKAIDFPWSKKLSPRVGFVYDTFGDSSLKIFGSFGIYQDVMKLDVAANGFGGFKWKSAYYLMDDYDFTKIGVNGNYPGTFLYTYDYRPPSFNTLDPDIKPFSQREISLGLEKKLAENVSFSLRLVSKSVLNAIEDSAIYSRNKVGMWEEMYFYSNPGSDYLKKQYDTAIAGGQLAPGTPYLPKAKREYLGANFAVEKRFSDRWLGGASYTLSRLSGNYSGLYSSDEVRNSPNGERAFDLWYLCFDKQLKPLDGPLATDRPHVFKAYGSYAFPFGLTVGGIFNAMSGTPITEEWILDSAGYYPFNRGNLGRTPFLTFTNLYVEYNFKFGGTTLQVNANVDNLFDTKTARRKYTAKYWDNVGPSTSDPNDTLYLQRQLIAKNWTPNPDPDLLDPLYGQLYSFYPPRAVRLGLRFIF